MSTRMPEPDQATTNDDATHPEKSFAETALELGGKSEEEARRTGAIDLADDQVERMFQPQYQIWRSGNEKFRSSCFMGRHKTHPQTFRR